MIRHAAYLAPLIAVACAPQPMSRERAEKLCREEAGLADGFRGQVSVGIGSGGPRTGGSVTITDRIFAPQTEAEFMAECVARRMAGGPAPTRAGIIIGASS